MSKPVVRYENGNLISYSGTANGDVLTWNSTTSEWQSLAVPTPSAVTFDYELFVAKNGNDITGTGSLSAPYLTIGAALTKAGTIAQTNWVRINVAPGSYSETLTITRSNVVIAGASATLDERATQIQGSVTINVTSATSVFGNNIELSGLYINTSTSTPAVYLTGSQPCSVNVVNCYLTTGQTATNVVKHDNTGSASGYATRLVLRDCLVSKQTAQSASVMLLARGETQLDTVRVYGSSTSATSGSAIEMTNASTLIADRLNAETYTPAAGISISGAVSPTSLRLTLSNSAVTTRYSAGSTAPAIAFLTCTTFLWQNLFTVSNASTKTVAGTGSAASAFCYYGQITNGPNAVNGAVYGSFDTANVTFLPMTETHGDLVLPSVASASYPLKVDANKKVVTGQINLATEVTGTLPAGNQAAQSMGGDVTGTTAASTVVALRGTSVSAVAPTSGQALVYSGSAWAPATITPGGGGGGGLTYYLNYDVTGDSPPSGYKELSLDYDENGGVSVNTGAVTPSDSPAYNTLAQFITDDLQPGATTIPPGLWEFGLYAVASHSDSVFFRAVVKKYDTLTTTLTTIATSADEEVTNTNPTPMLFNASVFVPGTTILSTDRLVVVIEITKTTLAARTITAYFAGDYPSHAHTTLGAPGGTGLVKVVDGVVQAPASLLVDADVKSTAAIAVSKLDGTSTNGYFLTTNGGAQGASWAPLPAGGSVTSVTLDTSTTGLTLAGPVTSQTITTSGTFTLGGTLIVSNGGTGKTTFTAESLLVGNGSGAIQELGPVASRLAGWNSSSTASSITIGSTLELVGTTLNVKAALPETYGGTGQSSYLTGQILYASATNTLSKLTVGTTGQVLTVSSGVPAWSYTVGTANTSFITDGRDVATPATGTVSFGVSIPAGYSTFKVTGLTGSVDMGTTSPTIATPGGLLAGTRYTLINSDPTYSITIHDDSAPGYSGTKIQLGGVAVRTLAPYMAISFVYDGSFWVETGVSGSGVVQSLSGGTNIAIGGTATVPTVSLTGAVGISNGGTGLTSAGGTSDRVLLTTNGTTFSVGTVPNAALANSSVTVTAGTGLSGGGSVALGSTVTLSLPDVGPGVVTRGSASAVPVITLDAQGRVTAATNTSIAISASAVSGIPYDLAGMVPGIPGAGATVFYFKATRAFTLSATAANHVFTSAVAATGTAVFTVKNGANTIFQATFSGGNTATIGSVTNNSIAIGDVITVVAPSPADSTLSDIYWTLTGSI